MEFFLASSNIVNIWESFLKKSTEKTPYDEMIWKNNWINHFSNGYKFTTTICIFNIPKLLSSFICSGNKLDALSTAGLLIKSGTLIPFLK